jgi:hypothetical protein
MLGVGVDFLCLFQALFCVFSVFFWNFHSTLFCKSLILFDNVFWSPLPFWVIQYRAVRSDKPICSIHADHAPCPSNGLASFNSRPASIWSLRSLASRLAPASSSSVRRFGKSDFGTRRLTTTTCAAAVAFGVAKSGASFSGSRKFLFRRSTSSRYSRSSRSFASSCSFRSCSPSGLIQFGLCSSRL